MSESKTYKCTDFPGGPVAKTPCCQCGVPGGSIPGQGTDPTVTTNSLHVAIKDSVCHG